MTFLTRQEHTFFRHEALGFHILLEQIRSTISASPGIFVADYAGI